ncbi:hypothetical protein evm_015317, partial [Chilo suppressalis]
SGRARLDEANTLHQFFRDIADEESWIKEKKLLVASDDYGRDLTGVQNLQKKHKRLEAELASHEPAIQGVQEAGEKLMDVSNLGVPEIEQRLKALALAWAELQALAAERGQKLHQSLAYQQFLAKLDEEEAWISEKQQLVVVGECGDSMAAVQGLLKKHEALEAELAGRGERVAELSADADRLLAAGNLHADALAHRMRQLQVHGAGRGLARSAARAQRADEPTGSWRAGPTTCTPTHASRTHAGSCRYTGRAGESWRRERGPSSRRGAGPALADQATCTADAARDRMRS